MWIHFWAMCHFCNVKINTFPLWNSPFDINSSPLSQIFSALFGKPSIAISDLKMDMAFMAIRAIFSNNSHNGHGIFQVCMGLHGSAWICMCLDPRIWPGSPACAWILGLVSNPLHVPGFQDWAWIPCMCLDQPCLECRKLPFVGWRGVGHPGGAFMFIGGGVHREGDEKPG